MNNTDILDACLKAIERGEATIGECVARYPQVDGLREMLIAAQDAHAIGRPIMSMAARTVLEQRLITRMESSSRKPQRLTRLWTRIPITLAATVLLVLIIAAGVLRLSSRAVPGDVFYGVKRASEQASLAFASARERPAVLAQIAEARLAELATLASRKWPVNTALADAMSSLNAAAAAQPDPAVRAALYARGIQTLAQLAASGQAAPSLMSALRGIATPTLTNTPITTATNTEASTGTPTTTATNTETPTGTPITTPTNTETRPIAPPPTRLAPANPIPTRLPPAVQPIPVQPSAPSGNGGGNNQPTPDNHGSGDGGGNNQPTPDNHGSGDGGSGSSHGGGDH